MFPKLKKILKTILPDILILIGVYTLSYGIFTRPTKHTLLSDFDLSLEWTDYHTVEKIAGMMLLTIGLLIIFRSSVYKKLIKELSS